MFVRADRRDVDHCASAGCPRGLRDVGRALVLHRLEGLLAGGEQDADQIDDRVGAARGGKKRVGVAHIRLHGVDLADAAERLEMAGKFGTPHRHPHARAGLGDGADEMAADKARAPVDGHERLVVENDGHLCPLAPAPCSLITRGGRTL